MEDALILPSFSSVSEYQITYGRNSSTSGTFRPWREQLGHIFGVARSVPDEALQIVNVGPASNYSMALGVGKNTSSVVSGNLFSDTQGTLLDKELEGVLDDGLLGWEPEIVKTVHMKIVDRYQEDPFPFIDTD